MEIILEDQPLDIDFHPSSQLLAATRISGQLLLYRYSNVADSTPERVFEVTAHGESCTAVRFINEGRAIITGSADHSIVATDVETGSSIVRLENAHGNSVNRIINVTESTIASADDGGCIQIWDTRQRSCCGTFDHHKERITDMTFASDSMKLLATSDDGTLSVCNLRSNKVSNQSEFSEDALLSAVIMKNGRKVICGTETGTLLLYSWGFFKDCSDRFVGLGAMNSVNALLKLDEDRLIAGCNNGFISLVGILPNRIIQQIPQTENADVDRLAFSHDKKFLGSISSPGNSVMLWDLDDLLQGSGNATNEAVADSYDDVMDFDDSTPKSSKVTKRKNAGKGPDLSSRSNNFFADM